MKLKMRRLLKFCLLTAVAVLSSFSMFAQEHVEMADTMRSEGKIYVVVAMILVILFGFIGYLFTIDRKMGRLEKRLEDRSKS